MNAEEVIAAAQEIVGAVTDCPFEGDFESAVLRHADTKKWFGIVMQAPGRYFYGGEYVGMVWCVTLKCDPLLHMLLENIYEGIYPAWHMNKKLWVSIPLDRRFPDDELIKLLSHSFELTDRRKK